MNSCVLHNHTSLGRPDERVEERRTPSGPDFSSSDLFLGLQAQNRGFREEPEKNCITFFYDVFPSGPDIFLNNPAAGSVSGRRRSKGVKY